MTNESDFLVKKPVLVLNHLNDLVRSKSIITVHFGRKGSSFLTAIIDIDPEKDLICLDCGPTDELNKQLLASDRVLFRTEKGGVQVSFSGHNIRMTKRKGEQMLSMPIPKVIFWMERRHFHREKIPLSHTGSYCRLPLIYTDSAPEEPSTCFSLYDLSVGGLAFLNPAPAWTGQLQLDNEFDDCMLHLQSDHHAKVAFVIKNISAISISPTSVQQRIGCQFTNLPPNFDSLIQRYIHTLELLQKNLA